MSNENEVVSRFLKTKSINLPSSNDWLEGCVEWFKSQHDNYSVASLQTFALQQWLLADLRQINHGCLPPNLSNMNSTVLNGIYPMQINYFFNVGESAYSQYEKGRKLCLDDQSIGEEKRANWMPKPRSMLKMEMTDGVQTIHGFEYCPLTKLNETMEPGTKVILKGPIECRKGLLFLKDCNIEVLGGEVDTLCESNPTAHLLAEKLQLDPNVIIANLAPNTVSNTQSLFSQRNQTNDTHNRRTIDTQQSRPADESILLDSDDEIFLNIQTENDTTNQNNNARPPTNPSQFNDLEWPDDDIDIPDENVVPHEKKITSSSNTSRRNEERDLLEDDDIETSMNDVENCNIHQTNPPRTHSHSESVSKDSKTESFSTLTGIERKNEMSSDNKKIYPSISSNSSCNVVSGRESRTDICLNSSETVHCKVKKFKTKLLCQEKNWNLTVALLIDQRIVDATFDPELLNEIIGFSPVEMMAKQKEMAVNSALKGKFDKMLREAQLLIKDMNCKMTLQRSSHDNQLTIIHVDNSQRKQSI